MSLFAAGVAILALLFASYSRRRTWLVLGSTTLSVALIGCLLLATSRDPSQLRMRFAWIANALALVLDRQTAEELATSLGRIQAPSPCGAGQPGCGTEMAAAPLLAEREPVQAAAATAGWFDAKPGPKANSQSPVAWTLDDRDVQRPVTSPWGFSISGTNVSGETLEEVHAVLKPDSNQRELALALDVDGHKFEVGTIIPAGARFSLFSEAPTEDGSKQFGGAILSFRYVQAGQRKTSILYLSPSMVARSANPG